MRRKRHLRFALGDGVAREAVAEVGESEFQALGDGAGVGDGLGQIGEEARHFGGRFDVALGVALQQPAGFGEGDVVADAGEDVEQFALRGRGVGDAVGGDQRDAEAARAIDGGLVVGLLFALVVALEFGVEMARGRRFRAGAGSGWRVMQRRPRENSAISSRVAAPSPFLARSFMRVTRRQRFW